MRDIASSSNDPIGGPHHCAVVLQPIQLEGHSIDAMTNEFSSMWGVSFGCKGIHSNGRGFSIVGYVANTLAECSVHAGRHPLHGALSLLEERPSAADASTMGDWSGTGKLEGDRDVPQGDLRRCLTK